MQISNGLITFALITFIVFFIALILGWNLTWHAIRYLISERYMWIIALIVPILINVIIKKVVTMHVGPKQVIQARFSWMFFDLFQMLISCVTGIAKGITRFVMVTVVNILSLPRMDISIFPAWVDYYIQIDSGAKSYFGLILMYHLHNNPVMRVSCWILEDDARERKALLRKYLPSEFNGMTPAAQEDALQTAKDTWRTDYNEGNVALCSPAYRKASNMWNKVWMMHKNVTLVQYSASGDVMVSEAVIKKVYNLLHVPRHTLRCHTYPEQVVLCGT